MDDDWAGWTMRLDRDGNWSNGAGLASWGVGGRIRTAAEGSEVHADDRNTGLGIRGGVGDVQAVTDDLTGQDLEGVEVGDLREELTRVEERDEG